MPVLLSVLWILTILFPAAIAFTLAQFDSHTSKDAFGFSLLALVYLINAFLIGNYIPN